MREDPGQGMCSCPSVSLPALEWGTVVGTCWICLYIWHIPVLPASVWPPKGEAECYRDQRICKQQGCQCGGTHLMAHQSGKEQSHSAFHLPMGCSWTCVKPCPAPGQLTNNELDEFVYGPGVKLVHRGFVQRPGCHGAEVPLRDWPALSHWAKWGK